MPRALVANMCRASPPASLYFPAVCRRMRFARRGAAPCAPLVVSRHGMPPRASSASFQPAGPRAARPYRKPCSWLSGGNASLHGRPPAPSVYVARCPRRRGAVPCTTLPVACNFVISPQTTPHRERASRYGLAARDSVVGMVAPRRGVQGCSCLAPSSQTVAMVLCRQRLVA